MENASLQLGRIPAFLQETEIRSLLVKPYLNPNLQVNYWPVSNIPFLGKVLELVVVSQLQGFLDGADYINLF